MKRGFTLIETVIVLAIISILITVLLPVISKGYNNSKEEIINIYNGKEIKVIDIDSEEVIFQGKKEDFDLSGYDLVDIDYKDFVILYVRKNEKTIDKQ